MYNETIFMKLNEYSKLLAINGTLYFDNYKYIIIIS